MSTSATIWLCFSLTVASVLIDLIMVLRRRKRARMSVLQQTGNQ